MGKDKDITGKTRAAVIALMNSKTFTDDIIAKKLEYVDKASSISRGKLGN